MTTTVQMVFGLAGIQAVRTALGDRTGYATQFSTGELAPFLGGNGGGPPRLVDLVNALAPAGGGGLTQQEFKTLVVALGANPGAGGLTGTQMRALVLELTPVLAGLTAQQARTLLLDLITAANGPITATQARTLVGALRTGGTPITAVQVRAMFIALRGQLTPAHLLDAISELLPCTGARVHQIYSDLCHGGGGGLGGTHFRAVVRALRASPGHANALNAAGIDNFVNTLRGDGLTGTQIREIVVALVTNGNLTPAQSNTLVLLRLRPSVAAADVHELLTVTVGNPNVQVVGPAWLWGASAAAHGGQDFAFHLNAAVAHNANGFGGMRQLVARMHQVGFPGAWSARLLALFPTLTNARHNKLRNFLSQGAQAVAALTNDWNNDVLTRLDGFLTAGRAPHGAAYPRYADTGTSAAGGVETTRYINDVAIRLNTWRLNYFCNSHTYRYCHFANRLAQNVAAIEFWGAAKTRNQIRNNFDNLPDNWLDALAGVAMAAHDGYGVQVYNNTLEVGLQYLGWNNNLGAYLLSMTHFCPVGQNRVPTSALQAISNLFDDLPAG